MIWKIGEHKKKEVFEAFASKKNIRNYININRHKDGRKIILSTSGIPMLDRNGDLIGYRGVDIDITESKRAEEELKKNEKILRESEERYRSLFDRMMDGVYRSTHEGRFVEVNPAMVQMFGFSSREEMLNVDIKKELYFAPSERDSLFLDTGNERTEIFRMRRKDGAEIWVEDHGRYVHDEKGNVIFHEGILRDVTERKHAEEELKEKEIRYRTLFNVSPSGIILMDLDGIIIDLNESFSKSVLYTRDELIGKNIRILVAKQTHPTVDKHIKEILSGNIVEHVVKNVKKDGNLCDMELRESLVWLPDGRKGILSAANDITERKQAEQMLQKLNMAIHNANEVVFMTDKDGIITYINPQFTKMYGYAAEEIIGKTTPRILKSGFFTREQSGQLWNVLLNKQSIPTTSYINKCKNGSLIDIEGSADPILNENNEIIGFLAIQRDITERRKSEELLKENEIKFRTLADFTYDMEYWENENKQIIYISPSCERMTGYKQEEFIANPKLLYSIVHPDDISSVIKHHELINSYKNRDDLSELEFRIIRQDNSVINIYHTCRSIYDENKKYLGRRVSNRDITERHHAEELLRTNEEKFRNLVESINEVFYIADKEGKITYCSPNIITATGFTFNEILGNSYLQFIAPIDRRKVIAHYLKQTKKGAIDTTFEFRVHSKDGMIIWAEQITHIVRNPLGNVIEYRNVARDITERKMTEETLQKSEKKFRSVWEKSTDGMRITDEDGIVILANGAYCKLVEKPLEKIEGKKISAAYQEIMQDEILSKHLQRFRSRTIPNFLETEITLWNGKKIYLELSNTFLEIPNQPTLLLSVFRNITDRKIAEQEILESNEKLRALTARLERIKEEERINLSRELHDHLGQNLTGLKMDVAWLAKKMQTDKLIEPADFLSKTSGMLILIDELINSVRKISAELRPNVLDYLGLIPAIEWQIEELKKRTEIDCVLNSNLQKIDLGSQINSSVFRIVQEAFTNIVRHSRATKVTVSIKEENDFIKLEILDNGIGIKDVNISNTMSLGILGMNERTLQFNGKLNLVNAPQGGTLMTLTIPKLGKLKNDKYSYRR